MPQITIEISEQAEAKIVDAIQRRYDFILDGGRICDGEKSVLLKEIRFRFHESEKTQRVEKQAIR